MLTRWQIDRTEPWVVGWVEAGAGRDAVGNGF